MLQPLYGNVLLKKEKEENKTETGIILNNDKEKPSIAKVLATGEGHYEEVKKGDQIVFKKYSGTEFTYDKVEYLIVDEKDILAIIK